MDHQEWYLEYQIHKNRPGLMGDLASILGMLGINIVTINGVEKNRRGLLLRSDDKEKIEALIAPSSTGGPDGGQTRPLPGTVCGR